MHVLRCILLSCFVVTTTNGFVSPVQQQNAPMSRHNNNGAITVGSPGMKLKSILSPDVITKSNLQEATTTTTSKRRSTVVLHDDTEFVKPNRDNRKYRSIRLWNNLECLLISASESDVEAAAVNVKAGHMDDPVGRPGLAHFHEHMLFLGTEKYPSEQEYETFLNQHGGSSNAYTDMEDTNYYFSLTPSPQEEEQEQSISTSTNSSTLSGGEALHGGLDRLAQFFISPSFDPNCVDREMRAVDSEYRNSFTSDSWRNFQLLKSSASPLHPFSKFGCGNYETLTQGGKIINTTHSDNIGSLPVEDLKEFWKTHYQTYNLRLSVAGRSSLDDLQQAVEQTFGNLSYSEGKSKEEEKIHDQLSDDKYKNIFSSMSPYPDTPPAFGREQLGNLRYVVPLVEARTLKIYFATPSMNDPVLKESRPMRVVSHLLGHEAPGSLHAVLNELGYLTSLSSGVGVGTSDFSLFSLNLGLTPKGMKEKEFVLDLVFQWVALTRNMLESNSQLREELHEEMNHMSEMNFKFRENGDLTDFCSRAAELMFDYPTYSELLSVSVKAGPYDPVVAKAFLELLRPENSMITVVSSDLEEDPNLDKDGWKVEPWYGAKYQVVDIPKKQLQKWNNPPELNPRLKLPGLNRFIPTDFSLRCDDNDEEGVVSITKDDEKSKLEQQTSPPSILLDRPGFRFWHKLDRTWKVPKTFIRITLTTPSVYRSPRTMTFMRIYERMLNDDLNSFVYDAGQAGSGYRVSIAPTGVRISLSGYSEKLPDLLETVTTRMLSLIEELKQDNDEGLQMKFQKARDNLLRETNNYRLDTPYEIANYNTRLISEESTWYVGDYLRELEEGNLNMEQCGRVAHDCLTGSLRVEALCHGNIDKDQAMHVADVVGKRFQSNTSQPLLDVELPTFRAMKLPTKSETKAIFGSSAIDESTTTASLVYQEVAYSDKEENNALEFVLQAGCDFALGFRGVALLDLLSHLVYASAYNQLRTQEQLGYIVSASVRKVTGGAWMLAIIVQSSVALPSVLEERSEAWLTKFREELDALPEEQLAQEAAAVVAQLLERDTKLASEVAWHWGEIMATETLPSTTMPYFGRVDRIASELQNKNKKEDFTAGLKQDLLNLFDTYFAKDAPERRVLSTRIYNTKSRAEFDANKDKANVLSEYSDIQQLKPYLSTYPKAPYWIR